MAKKDAIFGIPEVQHVIAGTNFKSLGIRVGSSLERLGYNAESGINKVLLFSNPDVVDMLQKAPPEVISALQNAGIGTNRHDSKTDVFGTHPEYTDFEESVFSDIEENPNFDTENKIDFAVYQAISFFRDLSLGKITLNGSVVGVMTDPANPDAIDDAWNAQANGRYNGTSELTAAQIAEL